MANTFTLLLTYATLISGLFWAIVYIKTAPARCALAKQKRDARRGSDTPSHTTQIAGSNTKAPPGWLAFIASLFPVLFLVFFIRSFIYEPFQIPSGSMMPTLLIGDFVLVEKYAYGIKDPITQRTLIETGHPKRGDIAVFKYPLNTNLDYIKRVVGLPGDTVYYNNATKTLKIKPACHTEPCPIMALDYSPIVPSHWFIGRDPSDNSEQFYHDSEAQFQAMRDHARFFQLLERQEQLGKANHAILLSPYSKPSPVPLQQEWVVPAGHYFMMGDSRDNSTDSRVWGFVPERNLVGKATTIWLSFEKKENKWPTGTRFNRIGTIH